MQIKPLLFFSYLRTLILIYLQSANIGRLYFAITQRSDQYTYIENCSVASGKLSELIETSSGTKNERIQEDSSPSLSFFFLR